MLIHCSTTSNNGDGHQVVVGFKAVGITFNHCAKTHNNKKKALCLILKTSKQTKASARHQNSAHTDATLKESSQIHLVESGCDVRGTV